MAEEATQQAFGQAWRAAGSYDTARDVGSWLATIARRAAIDVHRREARSGHGSLDDALDPDDAELVRLQHFVGLTHTQIAERLGVPVGTVKSRSFRVHRRLAGSLGHLRDNPAEPSPVTPG